MKAGDMFYRLRGRFSPEALWNLVWQIVFVFLVFGPLLVLVLELLNNIIEGKVEWIKLLIPEGRRLGLFMHSLGLSAGVALAGMIFGLLAGGVLWKWQGGAGTYLKSLVLLFITVPPYIHATAWTNLLYFINSWLLANGIPQIPFGGWSAAWWVQLMAFGPAAIGLTILGLETVEPALIDAARIFGTDARAYARVVLPLAAPAILAGGGFVFLFSLVDYSIPSLFSVNVYSLEIFAEYSASNEPSRALLLAMPLLMISAVVIIISQSGFVNAVSSPPKDTNQSVRLTVLPGWLLWLQRFALIIVTVEILVPLLSLLYSIGSWNSFYTSIVSSQREIMFTFEIAFLAAVTCLPAALAAAMQLARTGWQARLWWFLVCVPLAVPASLTGIGLIVLWNRPGIPPVYGTLAMPVLAALARFAPLAAIVLLTRLRRIDPLLLDAARIHQKRSWMVWTKVLLPLLTPGIIAACGIVAVLTIGELPATLIVVPPGVNTMTLKIYNYLHYGSSGDVAGLCLFILVVVLTAGLISIRHRGD
jgi:iron(III) transport system permease protein